MSSDDDDNNKNHHAYGTDMNQEDMMESDMLIVVDENDVNIGPAGRPPVLSKRGGHTFTPETPRAVLHRAFSFFLFDENAKMLLTQRAASKITFPNVWTNTCCSHPLHGMIPNEVDQGDTAHPVFPGIKQAALRKCKQELGINLGQYVSDLTDDIKFVTKFHYWAADTVTYGKETVWGEHEVDYILFLQLPTQIPVNPNSEEVQTYKWVSLDELKHMMKGDDDEHKDLLWSPWFRGIMDRGGWDWWADMEGTLAGKYTNDKVTFFEPPAEHYASYNLHSHSRQTGVLSSTSATATPALTTAKSTN